ncbi:Glyoxalase/Bleomycin resistance protein/Dihydroxybiphenyl dioxygenase [Mucor lusitanicus]|uniref:lactoylglutathione lyase n=2 Tax=Mucor circinelloides f. lusitanicus TaxID=29924 RepID=A0A162ZDG9_MUCCL|nr:lactoylglutathione lyase [Mucor lusitanicus]OAD06267.1 hypothetical protein MUCCIDRAFT_106836 [Mucor lusitanicus CBS 277.49]
MATDTSTYSFNHTMIRVKDPQASVKFYTEILGMKYITKHDLPDAKATLYFLAFVDAVPETQKEKLKLAFSHSGVIELLHNWGTEDQPDFAYNNGNKDNVGRGFGHTSVLVDDLKEACKRLESLGVKFHKKPTEGGIHTVAFIADPDDYWVEIIGNPLLTGENPL